MKSTYIIGEIGQNHNGSVDIAKLIVDLVSRPVREEVFNLELRPMDAVKMTKRDLNEELTDSQMNRPYDSPHSFGRTYGDQDDGRMVPGGGYPAGTGEGACRGGIAELEKPA